ncbi:MAG TPA: hypothetical protein VN717_04855 [Gemmatimonadaceae bacterium]|nr:hypothetical protein [Gemmatimonadaceae bacterium]
MLAKFISTLAGAIVVGAALVAAPAPAAAHPSRAASSDSVTGCLKKGDKPNTYSVTTQDGKTVWVASQSVSLAGHVGHTVTLTGNTQTESMGAIADSSKPTGMSDSMKMGNSVMQVTKLSMVSASCK